MNDKYSTTEGKTSEKLSDEAMLSAQWKNIDWHGSMMALLNAILLFDILNISREICYSLAGMRNPG